VHLDSSEISYLAFNFFVIKEPGKVYRHVIRYKSWPKIERFKKHKALAHCKDVPNSIGVLSLSTRSKISASLQDRTYSEITRARKSKSKQGENNPFYGKGPGIKALVNFP
jgi:hypothetical protein